MDGAQSYLEYHLVQTLEPHLQTIVGARERLPHRSGIIENDSLDGRVQARAEEHEADGEDEHIEESENRAKGAREEAAAVEVVVRDGPLPCQRCSAAS